MVDQFLIQRRVARGMAKAAQKVGAPAQIMRPTALAAPLTTESRCMMADFSASPDYAFRAPPLWDKPTTWALMDTDDVRPGDIIVAASGTYFVSRFEPWRPVSCVLTNSVVSLTETAMSGSGVTTDDGSLTTGTCTVAGLQDPYGTSSSNTSGDTTSATDWPAYISQPKAGVMPQSGTSGAVKAAAYGLLLPLMPNYLPRPYMQVTDAHGISYTIFGVTTSQYGSECLMTVNQA